MAWVRLDDGFYMHPKVIGLSDEAFRLHVSGLCYASQHQTDGQVPEAFIDNGKGELVKELLASCLWEPHEIDGYRIHDFLLYNPSRADRRSRSESAADAARMRWAKQMESDAPASRMPSALGDGVGVGDKNSGGGVGGAFARFWAAYPRKQSKAGAVNKFERLVKVGTDPEAIVVGAERYRDDPNRDPAFTKLPTTWLNNGCWEDEPLPPREQAAKDPYRNLPDFTRGEA